jgi:Activator of Hsp90 ATPase homolog 1-like protein
MRHPVKSMSNVKTRPLGFPSAPGLPGEMQTTITLKPAFCGTELNITQEGVPAAIPLEACFLGWQESLALLEKLVEAEIPDEQ